MFSTLMYLIPWEARFKRCDRIYMGWVSLDFGTIKLARAFERLACSLQAMFWAGDRAQHFDAYAAESGHPKPQVKQHPAQIQNEIVCAFHQKVGYPAVIVTDTLLGTQNRNDPMHHFDMNYVSLLGMVAGGISIGTRRFGLCPQDVARFGSSSWLGET